MKFLKKNSVRMTAGLLALMGLLVFACKQEADPETIVVTLKSIALTSAPTKTSYAFNEELDTTGLVVTATYSDNSTRAVPLADCTIEGFDSLPVRGSRTVTVTYGGQQVSFTIMVNAPGKTLESIEVTKLPTKVLYIVGDEEPNLAGLEITAAYSDQSTELFVYNAAMFAVRSFDTSDLGETEVVIEFGGKQASFTVMVQDTIVDFTFVNANHPILINPDIYEGEIPSSWFDGFEITAIYDGGSRKLMDNAKCTFTGDISYSGDSIITVTYSDESDETDDIVKSFKARVVSQPIIDLYNEVTAASKAQSYSQYNPIYVKVSSALTRDDIKFTYSVDAENIIGTDNIGALYVALAGKYVNLDFSEITWTIEDADGNQVKGIPGAATNTIASQRLSCTLVNITFPRDLVQIGNCAFYSSVGSLKKIDLGGLSELKQIGDYAFVNASRVEEIDFSGCTSLGIIGSQAFAGLGGGTPSGVELLDLSECTSLTRWGDQAFVGMNYLKYVELPPQPFGTGDYSMQASYNLRYIRFRSTAPRVNIGWSTWLYVMNTAGATYNRLPLRHYKYNASQHAPHTMQTYVMYHPNTVAWNSEVGGYYTSEGSRDSHIAHHLPLPLNPSWTQEGDPVYDAALDALRGEELLAYDDKVRGQATVTINASGLPSGLNGTIKPVGYSGGTITVSGGGSVNATIGTPSDAELTAMNGKTLQAVTGYYNYADPAQNLHPLMPGVDNPFSIIRYQDRYDWTSGSYTGTYGEPVWWPNDVKFAVLDLSIKDTSGKVIGNLARWAKGKYNRTWDNGSVKKAETVRVIKYVYVDQDVNVFRTRRNRAKGAAGVPDPNAPESKVAYAELALKRGWNQLEVTEHITNYDGAADDYVVCDGEIGNIISVSGAVTVDNANGTPEIKVPIDGLDIHKYSTNIPYKTMPWVYRAQDDWHAIISPTYAGKMNSPYRTPDQTPAP